MSRRYMISLLIQLSLVVQYSNAGQLCSSCSDIIRPEDCQHHIRCSDDEQCYIRRYVNGSGSTLYELGCTLPEACVYSNQPIVIGKRDNALHFKCMTCCNDSTLCNKKSGCILSTSDELQVCASCSSQNRPIDCRISAKCDVDEKCYIQRYRSESGSEFYDLGCIAAPACQTTPEAKSLNTREDHHLRCLACCEGTMMCNQNLTCGEPIDVSTTTLSTLMQGKCLTGYEVSQWVSNVTGFSSEYTTNNWAANSVVGQPDVYPRYGDIVGAWAQRIRDYNQTIDLQFPEALHIECIDIYETYNAGGVMRILARDINGTWQPIWSTPQAQRITKSRIFSPPLQDPGFLVQDIRLEVDCKVANIAGWVEIDAVQMAGSKV